MNNVENVESTTLPAPVFLAVLLALLWGIAEVGAFIAGTAPSEDWLKALIWVEQYRLFPFVVAVTILIGSGMGKWMALLLTVLYPSIPMISVFCLKAFNPSSAEFAERGLLQMLVAIVSTYWPSFLFGIPVTLLAFSRPARRYYSTACRLRAS